VQRQFETIRSVYNVQHSRWSGAHPRIIKQLELSILALIALMTQFLSVYSTSLSLKLPFAQTTIDQSPYHHFFLRRVSRCRHVSATTGPVHVDILTLGILGVGSLRLDSEGVGAEVVALRLEEVGGKILGAVPVEPRQGGRESRGRDTEQSSLRHNVTPTGLRLVDGLVEETIEEQVLQVGVVAIRRRDVLEEDGADDAATAPHEGNRWLVELPVVLLGGLLIVRVSAKALVHLLGV